MKYLRCGTIGSFSQYFEDRHKEAKPNLNKLLLGFFFFVRMISKKCADKKKVCDLKPNCIDTL